MPNLISFTDRMGGKAFREGLNSNFEALNNQVSATQRSVETTNGTGTALKTDLDTLKKSHNELMAGLDNVLITSTTSDNGTTKLPTSNSSAPVTMVSNETFENVTNELNAAIQNIIKGNYLNQGDNIELAKSDSGVTISSKSGDSVNHSWQHSNPNLLMNWDWRHPSTHTGVYSFIKSTDETETAPHRCIDCWEISYPNKVGTGYTFLDKTHNIFVATQHDTDDGSYANISQSFPDDWGDTLIGKKLTLSVACADSEAEYNSGKWYVYNYTFTASEG